MKLTGSIRWRLLLWYGSVLVLILSGLGFTAFHYQRTRLQQDMDSDLQRRAGLIASSLLPNRRPFNQPNSASLAQDAFSDSTRGLQRLFNMPSGGQEDFTEKGLYYYAIFLRNDQPPPPSANAPADIPRPQDGKTGTRTRGDLREFILSAQPGDSIVVGISTHDYQARLLHFGIILVASVLGILGTSLLGGWWIITVALRPIHAITEAANKIATGDLSRRIDGTETGSELGELASLLNETFARLEDAFAQQSSFTADAAHELRTPVSVILTHSQNGLSIAENNDEQKEAFEACHRAAQRMRKLTESLLQLTRFTSGSEAIDYIPCDLALIAWEAVEMIRPLAETRNITIRSYLGPAEMRGDSDRLHQVLINLLTNAIHYGYASGEINVTTRKEKEQTLCIISDNGPGIDPKNLPHIFNRFYRADKARTAAAGRTGLGLAICQAIVEAHGGKISATSTPGKGTTFTMAFPGN